MGLCVHPALLWSRAGQASIWVQAKNSFPWREPPTRPRQQGWSRGCRGKQVLPTLSPGRRRDRPGAGTRNRVLSLPTGCLLPCEGFWSSYIRKQCIPGIAASPVIREMVEGQESGLVPSGGPYCCLYTCSGVDPIWTSFLRHPGLLVTQPVQIPVGCPGRVAGTLPGGMSH